MVVFATDLLGGLFLGLRLCLVYLLVSIFRAKSIISRCIPGMARLARLVVPGLPRHITQRGNRRQQVFFDDGSCASQATIARQRGCSAKAGRARVLPNSISSAGFRPCRTPNATRHWPGPGLRKIDPGSWMRVGGKCASFLPWHAVRSWAEGPWFPALVVLHV